MLFFELIRIALGRQETFSHTPSDKEWHELFEEAKQQIVQDAQNAVKELFNNAPNLLQTIQKVLDEDSQLKKQVEEFKQEKVQEVKKMLIAKG